MKRTLLFWLVMSGLGCSGSDKNSKSDASGVELDGGERADGSASPDSSSAADAATLPPGLLPATPYLSFDDSPFKPLNLAAFHLEDFEDAMLNTPGATADTTATGSNFGVSLIDSVDGDDEVIDGTCQTGCDSLFGSGQITFTFDAEILGQLPTHVGVVWTDGGGANDVTFEAFDSEGISMGTTVATALADASNNGETAEDRFFGIVAPDGVGSIRISNTSGGTEADHLQYGF